MARDFAGGVSTDRIFLNSFTAHAAQRTYALWVLRQSAGGGNFGRMFDKDNAELLFQANPTTSYTFGARWSGATGLQWYWARPAQDVWVHVCVTYDNNSVSNDPKMYYDAVDQGAPTEEGGPPSGSPTTNANVYVLGNRDPGTDRAWDGYLAEWVVYNRVLTPNEVGILYVAGPSALPYNPAHYLPTFGVTTPEPDWSGNGFIGQITGTTRVDHPPRISAYRALPRLVWRDFQANNNLRRSIRGTRGIYLRTLPAPDGVIS